MDMVVHWLRLIRALEKITLIHIGLLSNQVGSGLFGATLSSRLLLNGTFSKKSPCNFERIAEVGYPNNRNPSRNLPQGLVIEGLGLIIN